MKTRVALVVMLLMILTSSKITSSNIDSPQEDKQRADWKKMVFCLCLYKAAPYAEAIKEEDGSVSGYLQINEKYGVGEDLEETIVFVDEYLDKVKSGYKSSIEADLTLMKCIDLYESEELDKFMDKLDAKDRD